MTGVDALVGLAIVLGLVGVILPVLPGTLMAGGAIALWAAMERAWWLLALAVAISAATVVVKYAAPARAAARSASNAALVAGALGALAGFLVIPVVGMVVGFLAGVFGAEWLRQRQPGPALTSTRAAAKSIGITMAVELAAIILMAGLWVAALLAR